MKTSFSRLTGFVPSPSFTRSIHTSLRPGARSASTVDYEPGESTTGVFGGNSNWRGPIWFPMNYLIVEALERYHHFYGDDLKVECPTGSGKWMTLRETSHELASRLTKIFIPDPSGRRPCFNDDPRFATDPYWKNLVMFHEYFHGDTGKGLGANHQTGWTGLGDSPSRRLRPAASRPAQPPPKKS